MFLCKSQKKSVNAKTFLKKITTIKKAKQKHFLEIKPQFQN